MDSFYTTTFNCMVILPGWPSCKNILKKKSITYKFFSEAAYPYYSCTGKGMMHDKFQRLVICNSR